MQTIRFKTIKNAPESDMIDGQLLHLSCVSFFSRLTNYSQLDFVKYIRFTLKKAYLELLLLLKSLGTLFPTHQFVSELLFVQTINTQSLTPNNMSHQMIDSMRFRSMPFKRYRFNNYRSQQDTV